MKIIVFLLPLICTALSEIGDDMTLDKCECNVYLHNEYTEPIYTESIREKMPKELKCTNVNTKKCENMCYTTLKEETNDFDLTKIPKTAEHITVSAGEYICESIKDKFKNIDTTIGVAVHYKCHGPVSSSDADISLSGKIGKTIHLKCVDGKFVQK